MSSTSMFFDRQAVDVSLDFHLSHKCEHETSKNSNDVFVGAVLRLQFRSNDDDCQRSPAAGTVSAMNVSISRTK
ncbi:Uncharacterized protein APZ42_030700 [Daphnia magna]|nr:Uncharacterized protein APZ42_030700 [Daphnia magna]